MEVAALVLGVYPVVIMVFEQFKTGAEYFSNWRRFRRQYEGFIRDIEAQKLFFEGTLQDLLCGGLDPYLSGHDSKETFLRIVEDPSYPGWTDPLLAEKLKARLDKRYDWYMYTIRRIYYIYQELEDVLDIEVLQSSDRTPDWWRYQWERIKKTLFEERYEQHKEATRLINELKQMLALSDTQPRQGNRAVSSIVPFLNRVRTNAYNLHDALKSAWHCHCRSAHKALLQLERRDHDREADFNLLFVLRDRETNVLESDKDVETEFICTCIERDVCIKVFENERKSKKEEDTVNKTIESVIPHHSTGTSLSSSPLPSAKSSETLLSPSVRPATRSNKSHESIHSTASSETGSLKFFHGLKDKWSLKIRSSRGNVPTLLSLTGGTQVVSFDQSPGSNPSAKSMKSAKAMAGQIAKHSQRHNIAVVTGDSDKTIAHVRNNMAVPATTEIAMSRDDSKVPEENTSAKIDVLDLCSKFHKSLINTYLDYISNDKKEHFRFLLGPKVTREKESSITLQELLEGEPHRFPPMKRVLVATIIASSVLQLQRTQWINDEWSKSDIFFRTRDGQVVFEQLYLASEFASSGQLVTAVLTLSGDVANADGDMRSNSTMTSKDTPATVPTPSTLPPIKPSHIKISLECLGIILIELCLGEPIERRSDKVHVRPSTTSPSIDPASRPPPNHDFCLAIANAWTWEEINTYEPSFSDPIDMCLRFPNLGRAGQGKLDEVMADVYAAVVRPLQDGLERRMGF